MIKINNQSKTIIAFLVICYLTLSLFKLHTSSIAAWDYFLGKDYRKSVLFGEPQPIRQDEWMINTPNAINLYDKKETSMSEGLKYLIKPMEWPKLIFANDNIEKGFAFDWNLKIFGFIITTFILFLLLTSGNTLPSFIGTMVIFLSSAYQWWSYQLGVYIISFNLIAIGFLQFVFSEKKTQIFLGGWLLLSGLYSILAEGLYPAWQVPLAYMYLAVIGGFMLDHWKSDTIKKELSFKLGLLSFGFILFFILAWQFYQKIIPMASALLNTEYPGKRFSLGGDVSVSSLFNEYVHLLTSTSAIPSTWSNICESSGVILVLPVIVYCLLSDVLEKKSISKILMPLLIYLFILLWWILIGFVPALSKITLMSYSPGPRTLPVFGISSIFLLIMYLSNKPHIQEVRLKEVLIFVMVFSGYFVFSAYFIQSGSNNFFKFGQLSLVLLMLFVLFMTIRFYTFRKTYLAFAFLITGFMIKNITIHPLTKGLGPLTKNQVTRNSLSIKKEDPDARWAVFGSERFSALLVPARINKLNGVQPVPPLDDLKILDPQKKYEQIYNRFAHISLFYHPSIGDEIIFQLPENKSILDSYTIIMHPCNAKLKQLKIKYLLFTYKPKEEETKCLTLKHDMGNQFIYQIL